MSVEAAVPTGSPLSQASALDSGEVHVWLAGYGDGLDLRTCSAYRQLLSSEEREQEPRFYFARDRLRYLLTRTLARTVLSGYLDLPPGELRFGTNEYGRPELTDPQARAMGLTFNLAHTHSLIVLAVATRCELGVDVENVRAREAPLEVADGYFAQAEVEALRAAPAHERQERFFEYWTFKEAYVKARGLGLSLPLDQFQFRFPGPHAVAVAMDPVLGDHPGRWQFWQFRPAPEYLVALCAERTGPRPSRVVLREGLPMHAQRAMAPRFSRVSANLRNDVNNHYGRFR